MRRIWHCNSLSIVVGFVFLVTLYGQSVVGYRAHNDEQRDHHAAELSYSGYLKSPEFLEVTAENWESEFLQMAAYVILTVFLFQKGSAESKDPDKPDEAVNREPDPLRKGAPGPVKRGGIALMIYKNSLSLAFLGLFAISFYLHAVGGAGKFNASEAQHGHSVHLSPVGYMGTSQFWFESLQNWQSEFLSVLAIVVLTIFLRQQGSAESKPVDAPHSETGEP